MQRGAASWRAIGQERVNTDDVERQVCQTGEPATVADADAHRLRYVMPLKSVESCISCHEGAKEGDVLGAASVTVTTEAADAARASLTRTIVGLFGLAAVLGTVVLGLGLTRTVIRPVREIVHRIQDIAEGEGDLTKRIPMRKIKCSAVRKCGLEACPEYEKEANCWDTVGSNASEIHCPAILSGKFKSCRECSVTDMAIRGEIDELRYWFNTFISKVHNIIADVARSASEVASASTEIAASSEEMAVGMNEQTQQTTHVSAAVEEMSASVIEVARKSGEVAGKANESGQVAEEGGKVVAQTIEGMKSINEAVTASAGSVAELGHRGEQIGEIIEVINDIADQTNLLALNAAIEAARAGEHGRGFAVVADEVRKLADRTTKATEKIGESIKAIQTETTQAVERMNTGTVEVERGVESATEAGASLQKIVGGAQEVAGMIRDIAAAAEQQSVSAEEISRNIESISAVTRQATEGAGQAATAATQLSRRAEELQTMVGQFKISP